MEQVLEQKSANSNDTIFNIVFKEDEITWQTMIHELIRTEQMDPWDIDVSLLSDKYIEVLKKMQGTDLRISGKVVLAAAILLKIKSERFIGEDMAYFDNMMKGQDDIDLADDSDLVERPRLTREDFDKMRLIPKTPQPRSRKVSIYDLVEALQKALEVQKRRNLLSRVEKEVMQAPEKKMDVSEIIRQVHDKVKLHFDAGNRLTFTQLINNSEKREDKVYTFIPLLHLSNQRKVDLLQDMHFGEIEITQAKPDIV